MLVLHLYFFSLSVLLSRVSADDKTPFNLNFHQNDYKLKFEWGQVVRYNKQYLVQFDAVVFKYNRSCTALNFTHLYKIDVGNGIEVITQAYKFSSNEYRQFPLRLQVNLCTILKNNLLGTASYYGCGNYTGCPLRKGKRVHVCNFVPDPSHFPPFIPNGRYKLEFQALYHGVEMWVANVYLEVYRPFV